MRVFAIAAFLLVTMATQCVHGQRITTIQLDGVQYFVSRMNPYSPELNYFLAYQYCRSLGLQLASFESREKADSITQYLSNAGYTKYDFWTSGNRLGTDMFLWMSTGLPFNATFNYMKRAPGSGSQTSGAAGAAAGSSLDPTAMEIPSGSTAPQRTARHNGDSGSTNGCVALRAPTLEWDTADCTEVKDFICEQTRCYYYNYGSIPVSSAQGKPLSLTTTTTQLPPTTPYTMTSTIQPSPSKNKQSDDQSEEQKQVASDSTEEENHSAEVDVEADEEEPANETDDVARSSFRQPELDSATRFSLSDLINTLRPHNQPMGKAASLMNLQHEPKDMGPYARHHIPQIDGHYSGINVLTSNSEVDQHHSDSKTVVKPESKSDDEFTTFMSLASDIDVNNTPTELPSQPDNLLKNEEASVTTGPYAMDQNEQLQGDDPNVDNHDEFTHVETNQRYDAKERDAFVSTVLPDMTTFKYMQSVRGSQKQTEPEH